MKIEGDAVPVKPINALGNSLTIWEANSFDDVKQCICNFQSLGTCSFKRSNVSFSAAYEVNTKVVCEVQDLPSRVWTTIGLLSSTAFFSCLAKISLWTEEKSNYVLWDVDEQTFRRRHIIMIIKSYFSPMLLLAQTHTTTVPYQATVFGWLIFFIIRCSISSV